MLFADWRAFAQPDIRAGVPDYSAAAMARKAADLPRYRARLNAIATAGWPAADTNDWRLIEAEMNGFEFFLRVLKPWARDPGFYQNVFGEESDVPAHEGPSASPTIDLFKFTYPLSPADDRKLTELLGGVAPTLTAARLNLASSNAADLWRYGDRAFREQSGILAALDRGDLKMRTFSGEQAASLAGGSPALRKAVRDAKAATDSFADWIAAEAPKKTGPSGVGKANYDWYVAHVDLSPYTWDQEVTLLQRELDRALTSLRLEEVRNRNLPPITPIDGATAFRTMAEAKTAKFNDFLLATGLVPDKPYFRKAMVAQTSSYAAPGADRNFFANVTALDPLPLLSHSTHWIELARLRFEPRASKIRQTPPLFNIFADRSEGFATAMEEIVMQAGLYDDIPHGSANLSGSCSPIAPRAGSRRCTCKPMRSTWPAPGISTPTGHRATGRTHRASSSASSSFSTYASPATVRATSSARFSWTASSRALRMRPKGKGSPLCSRRLLPA